MLTLYILTGAALLVSALKGREKAKQWVRAATARLLPILPALVLLLVLVLITLFVVILP